LYQASQDLVAQIPGHDKDPALKQLRDYENGTDKIEGRIKFINDHIDSIY